MLFNFDTFVYPYNGIVYFLDKMFTGNMKITEENDICCTRSMTKNKKSSTSNQSPWSPLGLVIFVEELIRRNRIISYVNLASCNMYHYEAPFTEYGETAVSHWSTDCSAIVCPLLHRNGLQRASIFHLTSNCLSFGIYFKHELLMSDGDFFSMLHYRGKAESFIIMTVLN